MKSTHATAPGKIILFGEHAVVHGYPAIAVPLTAVQATATVEQAAPGTGLTVHAPDIDQQLSVRKLDDFDELDNTPLYNALLYPLMVGLQALQQPIPDLTVTVRSTIPIASGLGSGAALATALMRALSTALEKPLDNDALNPLVFEVEKRHHGTPSGIDNTVIVYEMPVYFVRGQPPETFDITRPLTLLVADTGLSSPTHITVGDVRRLYEIEPPRIGAVFDRIGAIVQAARNAIESGTIELLGPLMNENQALLHELTVSSAELDRLCDAARAAGAAGAKLSGGGRGGNAIALVSPDHAPAVTEALRAAGAVNIIQTVVDDPSRPCC
jgi:mevalonate kinase